MRFASSDLSGQAGHRPLDRAATRLTNAVSRDAGTVGHQAHQ
jgi:hypothetical protein